MCGIRTIFFGLALIGAANFLFPNAASAEFFGCHDKPGQVLSYDGHRAYASARMTQEFAAQTARSRVVIHPRRIRLSQNSVRQCRSTLVKEYRLSGAVFVPHMQCWWE
ncbi:MAG TPA: hypothetical protein VGF02_07865 [Pseudolabrys sp.]|jgi:hypothetical protein